MTSTNPVNAEAPGVQPSVRTFRLASGHLVDLATGAGSLDQMSLALPEGVYTTFRTYSDRRALHLDDHVRRLTDSARREGYPLALDHAAVRTALAQALDLAGYALARVRLTLTYDPPGDLYISLEPFVPLPARLYAAGVDVVTGPPALRRLNPQAKATRFIAPGSAARAEHVGANEVLLVGESGEILEGSSSNFFAVLHDTLYTADEGVLGGITRAMVLRLAESMLPVARVPVRVGDIADLSEAFLTSVSRAVLPVTRIDGRAIGDGRPGPITCRLMATFERELERELAPIAL